MRDPRGSFTIHHLPMPGSSRRGSLESAAPIHRCEQEYNADHCSSSSGCCRSFDTHQSNPRFLTCCCSIAFEGAPVDALNASVTSVRRFSRSAALVTQTCLVGVKPTTATTIAAPAKCQNKDCRQSPTEALNGRSRHDSHSTMQGLFC